MGGAEIFVITRHWITTSNRVGIPRQAERARVIRARSDKRQKALAFFSSELIGQSSSSGIVTAEKGANFRASRSTSTLTGWVKI
jgi:hypothetical protein